MTPTPHDCPRCHGQIISDHGRPVCLLCGYSPLTEGAPPAQVVIEHPAKADRR